MTYLEAVRALYALAPRGIHYELEAMRDALKKVGEPHRKLRYVHVAGTNGKGSVAALIERTLRAAGYKTGLYTSPHLHRFVERIQIRGEPASEIDTARRIERLFGRMADKSFPKLSFFEAATLLALETFSEEKCDVVVLEVGLGGRLDATNVIRPEVSIITRIARDHEAMLGATIAEIAAEKAGIIKSGVPVVSGVRDPEAREVIERMAKERGSDFTESTTFEGEVGIPGAHQRENAACALAAIHVLRGRGLTMSDAHIVEGVAATTWPARLERVGDVLLDAAHNPDGCAALAAHLHTLDARPRVLLFGCMSDKDGKAMIDALRPEIDRMVFVAPDLTRARTAVSLAEEHGGEAAPSIEAGLRRARELAGGGLVVACGSIFVVSAVRASVLGIVGEPPIAL